MITEKLKTLKQSRFAWQKQGIMKEDIMTLGDFLTMAAVIVAACLVYNFVKAYTKKK